MTNPLPIAWVNWSDHGELPPPSPDLDWFPLRAGDVLNIGWEKPGTQVVVVNLHPSDSLVAPALQHVVETCPLPVIVRIPAERLAAILPLIRGSDDLCSRDDSPAWLAHRIRRLLSSNDRDALTQLLNRRAFQKRLADALSETSHEKPLSLLMVELDHFSRINRQHGFAFGDGVLMSTAALLQSGSGILASRLAGDEFAVLAPGMDERKATLYAGDLCTRLAVHQSTHGLTVTASIGVVTAERAGEAGVLIQDAATAMYSAKGHGRNRAVHFRDLEREAARAGTDVQVQAFEAHQRVVTERAMENITLRGRQLMEDLQRRADHDSLTGLFNRGYLDRRLPRSCDEARAAAQPLSVALIDVDHFGLFNKEHGWPTGDQTLRDVANIIRQNVRCEDWVAKYGGEEIAVILQATREEAALVIERVRSAVANHRFRSTKGQPLTVTVSAGVVAVEPNETSTQLWDRVSGKVLEAKQAGRNQVRS